MVSGPGAFPGYSVWRARCVRFEVAPWPS